MNIDDLRDYRNWVGKSPHYIIEEVRKKGGWKIVFPIPSPLFGFMPYTISRVRNYFNDYPKELVLLGNDIKNNKYKKQECKRQTGIAPKNWFGSFKENRALSGQAYLDKKGRIWYQMVPVAGIYHFYESTSKYYKDDMDYKKVKYATVASQEDSPIFKLVCPDGTGGSSEIILRNKFSDRTGAPKSRITNFLNWVVINESDIEKNSLHRGSYNFSETTEVCSEQHTVRDVAPHEKDAGKTISSASKYYINPVPSSTLENRRFPSEHNGEKLIFDLPKMEGMPFGSSWMK